MKPAICEQFGIDFPLFAFSHCRDVVAAVTNAGGFGVLGATAFTPDWLDKELSWIDDHVGGKPYGVDLIVPASLSKRLYDAAPEPKRYVVIPGAGHNDQALLDGGQMIDEIKGFLSSTGLT